MLTWTKTEQIDLLSAMVTLKSLIQSLFPSFFLIMTEQETAKMGCFGFLKVMMFVFNGIIFVSSCDFLFYAL